MLETKERSKEKKFFAFFPYAFSLPFGNKKSMEGFMETKASEGMKSLAIAAFGIERRKVEEEKTKNFLKKQKQQYFL